MISKVQGVSKIVKMATVKPSLVMEHKDGEFYFVVEASAISPIFDLPGDQSSSFYFSDGNSSWELMGDDIDVTSCPVLFVAGLFFL